MDNSLFIEMEAAQFTKTGQAACGDNVRFLTVERENRHLAALSDGLGSGLKAHMPLRGSRRVCAHPRHDDNINGDQVS